jgi:hypothetical protein
MRSLLAAVRAHEAAADFLAWPGDLELDRAEHVEEVRLDPGGRLDAFAGDGAGGTFFFCGDGGEERPVLYADSEGGAAFVADGLAELLGLILVAPWWRDCRTFTPEESAALAAEYADDFGPGLPARATEAAALLDLRLPPLADALTRLHTRATRAPSPYRLLGPEGNAYEPFFRAVTAS